MRLRQFINERITYEYAVIEMIYNECMPFIKELTKGKFSRNLMYSGRSESKDIIRKQVRKDRQPLNTYSIDHRLFDDVFYDLFKVRGRSNAVFCSGDRSVTTEYGTTYSIFPIGKFKYIWSPFIGDLYEDEDEYKSIIEKYNEKYMKLLYSLIDKGKIEEIPDNHPLRIIEAYKDKIKEVDDLYNEFIKEFKKFIKSVYKTTDLNRALMSGNEIMVNCKEYYGIRDDGNIESLLIDYIDYFGTKLISKEEFDEALK